jgi:SAM-dependent methyltransferase
MFTDPYAFAAGYYDVFRSRAGTDAWPPVDFFADLVPDGARALEIGPGTGRITLAVAEKAASVHCLERSSTMRAVLLAKLAERPHLWDKVTVVDGSAADLRFGRRFDFAYLAGVLEHIPAEDRPKLFTALADHLEDGGVLALDMVLDLPVPDEPEQVVGEIQQGEMRYELSVATRAVGPDQGKLRYVYRSFLGGELADTETVERDHHLHRRAAVLHDLQEAGFSVDGGSVRHAPATGPGNPGTLSARLVRSS